MAEKKKTVYHYTDEASAKKIQQSGQIRANGGVFGTGAYFTSIPPKAGKANIARNNYDGAEAWERRESKGSTDYAIKVKMPASQLDKAKTSRNIFVHRGDVKLGKYNHGVMKVGKQGGGSKK